MYAVNDDSPANKKDEFFEQLNRVITTIGTTREIILLGDLNGRIGKRQQDGTVGPWGEEVRNDNGERLIEICEQNELRILNGFYPYRMIHKYTRTQDTKNLKTIIDYAITRRKTKLGVQDGRVYKGATCGSDHHLLKMKVAFPIQREARPATESEGEKTEETRYNLNSLDHDSTKTLYWQRLDSKLSDQEMGDTEQHCQHIKTCIHQEAAKEALA